MRKPKRKYYVYLIAHGTGCYSSDKSYVGSTYAVSEKQAINNVRYRTRDENHPYGGASSWAVGDYAEEGSVYYEYKAETGEQYGYKQ